MKSSPAVRCHCAFGSVWHGGGVRRPCASAWSTSTPVPSMRAAQGLLCKQKHASQRRWAGAPGASARVVPAGEPVATPKRLTDLKLTHFLSSSPCSIPAASCRSPSPTAAAALRPATPPGKSPLSQLTCALFPFFLRTWPFKPLNPRSPSGLRSLLAVLAVSHQCPLHS